MAHCRFFSIDDPKKALVYIVTRKSEMGKEMNVVDRMYREGTGLPDVKLVGATITGIKDEYFNDYGDAFINYVYSQGGLDNTVLDMMSKLDIKTNGRPFEEIFTDLYEAFDAHQISSGQRWFQLQ
tara:strand:+ start:299 stop:673 length:375 start_codon:yes stop_codon:yes gene_type:complete